jgi:hypothetical protein
MDQKDKNNKWSQLEPSEQLGILMRYRDRSKGDNDRFLLANDFFYDQVIANGLENAYMQKISFENQA